MVGGEWVVSGRPNVMYSPGPGLWSLVLGPFGPDLGPDLDLTWDLDLDLSLTICFTLDLWSVIPPRGRGKWTGSFSIICHQTPTDNLHIYNVSSWFLLSRGSKFQFRKPLRQHQFLPSFFKRKMSDHQCIRSPWEVPTHFHAQELLLNSSSWVG